MEEFLTGKFDKDILPVSHLLVAPHFMVACMLHSKFLGKSPADTCTWFPYGLENEKTFQSGKSQGILNRLEKSGNFTQNTGKVRKL